MESSDFILLNKLEKNKALSTNVLDNNFVLFIIGKPGSGKTTILQEMLLNPKLLNKKFDYILIFSPSPFNELGLNEKEQEEIIIKSFDLEALYRKIDEINKENKNNINFLIIFDDFISYFKKKNYLMKLTNLFFNRRHLLKNNGIISIILISQRYMNIPSFARTCCSCLLYFKLQSKEYKAIKDEHMPWINIKEMEINNLYDFFFINLSTGKSYKNFLK